MFTDPSGAVLPHCTAGYDGPAGADVTGGAKRAPASLGHRALDAAVRPVNLTPLGVGILAGGGLLATGLAPLSILVGGLSLVTWGTLVLVDVAASAGAAPVPAPARTDGIAALHLRDAMADVRAAAERVRLEIGRHDGVIGASLLEIEADCDALVEQALALAHRGDGIHRFLVAHDRDAIQREVDARLASARQAADGEASRAFRSAAEAKRRQLELWTELRGQHDHIAAELVAVEAALDELHARVVRLALLDPTDVARAGADASREVKVLRERMEILERSAARTLQEVG